MSIVRIAVASDLGVALVMKAMLESEGLDVLDIATSGHVSIAGADQGYYIDVKKKDAQKAVELLKEKSFGRHLVV